MFVQKLCVAFLTLALSSFAAQAAPQYHKFAGRDIFLGRAAGDTARQGGRNGGGRGGSGGSTGGKNGGNTGSGSNTTQAGNTAQGGGANAQTSLTLDPAVIAKGFASDGQEVPTAGQAASLTSENNFINFCLTTNLPITNGQQFKDGSCNPAPMGVIPSTAKMPSSKFNFPKNFGAVKTNTPFTIKMAIQNIQTGTFVNPNSNYYAAPQHLNEQGTIIGHSHVVIEQLDAIDQTTLTDPSKFAFFKGVNDPAVNGVLSVDVTKGLPAGVYKLSSINAAANHQPVLVAIAQHGSLDDAVYFFVTDDGQVPAGALGGAASGAAGAGGSNAGAGGAGAGAGTGAGAGAGTGAGTGAGAGAGGSTADNGAATASATGKGGAATATATGRGGRGGKGGKGGASATGKGGAATATDNATGKGSAATATATEDGVVSIATAAATDGAAASATATGKTGGGKGSNGASTSAANPAATSGTRGGSTSSKGSSGRSGSKSGSQRRN